MKTDPCGLNFGPGCANQSADRRISLCGGVHAVIVVMAHCVGKIVRGAGFGL